MKPRDYFILGCKLFGVWCLLQGIFSLIGTIPTFMKAPDLGSELQEIYMVTIVVTRLIPILYIALGIYLLRDGSQLFRFAYPDDDENISDLEEKFKVFIKIFGIYLLVTYIPDLLKTISSFITYNHAPRYMEMGRELNYMSVNSASSIGGVIAGLYCLKSGKIFIKLGLKSIQR